MNDNVVTREEIVDSPGISRLIEEMARDIAASVTDWDILCLIGIRRRGDVLARRLQTMFAANEEHEIPVGSLDITLYRDDFDSLSEQPIIGQTEIPFAIENKTLVLVDDVLFTGRTIRAALDEIVSFGRPKAVILAVLIDRGWRELPIGADFVGKVVETARTEEVQVLLVETDGRDGVLLYRSIGRSNG